MRHRSSLIYRLPLSVEFSKIYQKISESLRNLNASLKILKILNLRWFFDLLSRFFSQQNRIYEVQSRNLIWICIIYQRLPKMKFLLRNHHHICKVLFPLSNFITDIIIRWSWSIEKKSWKYEKSYSRYKNSGLCLRSNQTSLFSYQNALGQWTKTKKFLG